MGEGDSFLLLPSSPLSLDKGAMLTRAEPSIARPRGPSEGGSIPGIRVSIPKPCDHQSMGSIIERDLESFLFHLVCSIIGRGLWGVPPGFGGYFPAMLDNPMKILGED